jgi:hypothetical protein
MAIEVPAAEAPSRWGRRLYPRRGSTSRVEADGRKADESIAAPKGHGPPDPAAFPLQTGVFLGATMGAMMAVADPSGRHPSAARPPCWFAKAMPALGQYFSRLLTARPASRSPSLSLRPRLCRLRSGGVEQRDWQKIPR